MVSGNIRLNAGWIKKRVERFSFLCYRKVLSSVMVSAEKYQIRIMIDTDFTKKDKTSLESNSSIYCK